LLATAPPARRFFLLEVPGPWAPDLLPATGLTPDVARALHAATAAVGARLLVIRRPGRHPTASVGPRRWAVVERGVGVRWGQWESERELSGLDLLAELSEVAPTAEALALVCTQGRHDVCCAVEGRPVVAAAAADPRVDAWECSHLGGDRFAANLLYLPSGLLFGGLTAETTPAVLDAAADGRILLDHFRGRCGDPTLAQAAQSLLMRALGEDHPDHVSVVTIGPTAGPGVPVSIVAERAGVRYGLELTWSLTVPHRLTCRARADAQVRQYRLVGVPQPI
jgi:hypothetical protein